jgi:RNA polymerase sigma-70 factor (ECF subfamily)
MSARDRKAFTILVTEHSSMLLVYLRSVLRDPGAVDDVYQETWITAWRRLGDYDVRRPFAPWVRGIARRLALAHLRRARPETLAGGEELLDAIELRLAHVDTLRGDTWEEKVAQLEHCLRRLSPRLREILDLHYADSLGVADVARRVGASVEAVKKRLQRGRAALAGCLRESGLFGATPAEESS